MTDGSATTIEPGDRVDFRVPNTPRIMRLIARKTRLGNPALDCARCALCNYDCEGAFCVPGMYYEELRDDD